MPALTPSIGNIGRNSFMWRSYQPCSGVDDSLQVFVPAGFDQDTGRFLQPVSAIGNLDINAFGNFFVGSTMSIDALREIRNRNERMDELISEAQVKSVFDAYCQQLRNKNVTYHYNADSSPFDQNFKGASNCQGRAKGLLQIMAMLGVPKEQLNQVTIGSADDEDKKVCRKSGSDIVDADIYVRPNSTNTDYARNAVRIKLEGGQLKVRRTLRKPFANHYCVFLDLSSLSVKYWDPLLDRGYRNGFSDFFTSYQRDEALSSATMECFVNPDSKNERIYRLPHRSQVLDRQSRFTSVMNTATFRGVESELAQMSSEKPQVAFMVDSGDWAGQPVSGHPPVVTALSG